MPLLSYKNTFVERELLGSKDRRRVSDIVYMIIRCSDIFIFLGYTDPDQWFSLYQNLVQGDTIPYDENRDSIDFFSICTGIPRICVKVYTIVFQMIVLILSFGHISSHPLIFVLV